MSNSRRHNYQGIVGGAVLTCATYVYFLIFAQFAFLHLTQTVAVGSSSVRSIMGAMAAAGAVGSWVTGRTYRPHCARLLLMTGFLGCGGSAVLALVATNTASLCIVSLLVGASTALLTVSLSGSLPRFLSRSNMGITLGMATGLAYAVCNVPAIFAGSVQTQAAVAVIACLVGATISGVSCFPAEPEIQGEPVVSFAPMTLVFLALVWLDSGAFVVLQSTPALNRFGWGSATLQWSNAGIHLVAAALAGILLDQGRLFWVLGVALGCLASAVLAAPHHGTAHLLHWLYASGVSLYSTALIFAPMMNSGPAQGQQVARRAGSLFAVAGWGGSALGIGMAQDLHTIPAWFVGLATFVIAVSLGAHWKLHLRYVEP